MEFRIADTFTDNLARLTGDEQKAVKTTAFDLQLNPANPGMSFHKLDKARDKNFWSVRAGSDIRLIVHKTAGSLLLCYVDHHDRAYDWAERRKLETHPKTGAAQLVEIRERVEEIRVPKYIEVPRPVRPQALLFAQRSDEELLRYGVPPEWLADVREADEDTLLELAGHLPAEAAEALLELATGGPPQVPRPATVPGVDPFAHPDAQRRFRVVGDVEQLARALEFPWDKWTIFLHPAQRELVERDYSGPARVSGSAGTGKTIVALHRAVFLARVHPDSRVLLATFSDTLANALRTKLRRLISNEPRLAERLEVHAMDAIGEKLYERRFGRIDIVSRGDIRDMLAAADEVPRQKFRLAFLHAEWDELVDAWQLDSWEAYRDVRRLGRKIRLPEAQRAALWAIFEAVRTRLREDGRVTRATMFSRLAAELASRKQPPFEFVVVDESQDLSPPQLRFLAALGADRPNGLFFAGDLGQRIFQQPFSWKSLGVDIRGRARTLHVNYRTSHQIRTQADRLLAPDVSDVDGNTEERRGMVMACDDEVIPLQSRIESVTDDSDLEEVYDTERHLLYVACTRARPSAGDRHRARIGVPGRSA